MLKPLVSLRHPDERFKHMTGGIDELGNPRPCEIEDLYDLVRPLELGPAVPGEIREQFDNARHCFIYSWFAYDMVTLAESHCYAVLERSLGLKAEQEGRQPGRGLKDRLDDAVQWGWLNTAEFEVLSSNGQTTSRLDFLRRIRNDLAHGKTHLLPSGTLDRMRLCGKIITKLFPDALAQA